MDVPRSSPRLIEHPRAFAVALALTSLCVALFVARLVLMSVAPIPGQGGSIAVTVASAPLLAFAFVGGLLVARRPDNRIGWVCLASGAGWCLVFFNDGYIQFGKTFGSGPPPLSDWFQLSGWVVPAGLLGTFLLLLFPDGRLPSRRWRPVAWVCGITIAVLAFMLALTPDDNGRLIDVPDVFEPFRSLAVALEPLIVLLPLCFIASAASLVVRYRRANTEDREKLKWIAFAAETVAALYAVTLAVSINTAWGGPKVPPVIGAMQTASLMSFGLIPIAVGFAVLRYRLYDIDRIISRTLGYAIVTAVVAGAYALIVLGPVSRLGSGGRPQWLVAVGTLAAAALFAPVRRRVQAAIDHRFDRRRYDAERTIDAFTSRLREQIDLDDLGAELRGVVASTMQPSHQSLWVRGLRPNRSRNDAGTPARLNGH
jgi:hypothetical protein